MPKGYLREQFEDSPGYEGAEPKLSTKTLDAPSQSVENAPEPSPMERDDELRGSDEPLQVFEDEHNPTWSRGLRGYPDSLGFDLTHLLGPPVTTAGDGIIKDPDENVIPEGAHRHVWTAPFGPSGATPVTTDMILAYVDEGSFVHLSGCAVEEFTLNTDDAGGVKQSKKGKALFYEPVADPEITPTPESLAIRPFQRRGLKVSDWQGTIQDLEQFNLTVTNPLDWRRSMGVASAFPDVVEKGEGPIMCVIDAPKGHFRSADLEALMAADRFAVKALWQSLSKIGATAYYYRFWVQGDGAQYTGGGPQALENKRRIGADFQAKLTSDGAGASATFTLVNATASYATDE
jgi:hypothetical protein